MQDSIGDKGMQDSLLEMQDSLLETRVCKIVYWRQGQFTLL